MHFFTGNGADKPKGNRPKPWYKTTIGLLLIATLTVAIATLILSILQIYYSHALHR